MASGGAIDVAQRLQTWVAAQPRDATAWQLLGAAYAAQGQQLRALRAEAEAQVAHLDYAAAVDRYKAAQDLVRRAAGGDYIEASIIDTACARWNHCFGNRRSSAESITTPITE
jgi:predicted Zn-dependent protease